jgi:hypothetical protein
LAWYNLTVPEVTGRPPEVTVTTADAAENCGTLAEGTKLSVVTPVERKPTESALVLSHLT